MHTKLLLGLTALALAAIVAAGATAGTRTLASGPATVAVIYNKHLKANIVVDGKGRTLYMLTLDTAGKATCASADPGCPRLWPAFATVGKPRAAKGITASLLGTTKGARSVQQVTYNHHPLYYFAGLVAGAGDLKPGDIKGQAFYSVWYVLSPRGTPIKRQ